MGQRTPHAAKDAAAPKSSKASWPAYKPHSHIINNSPPTDCWAKFAAPGPSASPAPKISKPSATGRRQGQCRPIEKIMKHNVLVALCTAIAISFSVGCGGNHQFSEEARVTSPNGVLDAVIIREDGDGTLGGFVWHLFRLPKARAV